jgi:hypothetical protein
LSVFNTGAKYRLTPANFGAPTTGAELLTEMILVQDTVVSFVETGSNRASFMPPTLVAKMSDSLRRVFQSQKLMKPVVTHRCDKPITADVKDKVVVMELGTCDPSVMCLNAQNAGAKVLILIHPSNKADSILLKKGAGRDEIKIRCYSVTREVGARLAAILPSHVAIRKRVATPNQNMVAPMLNDSIKSSTTASQVIGTEGNGENTNLSADYQEGMAQNTAPNGSNPNGITAVKGSNKSSFTLAPNPSNDQTTLTYQFAKATDVTLVIEMTSGQVVMNKILRGVTVGSLDIGTLGWANGTYILSMQYGKEVKTKKFEVLH